MYESVIKNEKKNLYRKPKIETSAVDRINKSLVGN